MIWLARYLRNELAPMWYTVKTVLKRVIENKAYLAGLESDDVQEIEKKLDQVTDCCTCPNDRVRINELIKILEDESISVRVIFLWFIDVLEDKDVNKPGLVPEIRRQIPPAPGPVY